MATKKRTAVLLKLMIAGIILLSFSRGKKKIPCPKEGLGYVNTTSTCWYSPFDDSIPVGTPIQLEASVPKKFKDEISNTPVINNCSFIEGSLGTGMIYPAFKPAIDSFEIIAETGMVLKDTIHFSEGILKGFRTVRWDGSSPDSFKVKIKIIPRAKGVYSFALKQQGYKDQDCALYKYFLSPGNADSHLNYWERYVQYPSEDVRRTSYCIKVF